MSKFQTRVYTPGSQTSLLSSFINSNWKISMEVQIEYYERLFQKRVISRGKKDACSYLKSLYVYATKIALECTDIDPIPWTKSNKDGYPKDLNVFKSSLLSENLDHRRAALTILRQFERLYCEPEIDLSTIVESGPGPRVWEAYDAKWIEFLELRFKRLSPKVKDVSMFVSGKAGPNGRALQSAHMDALALSRDKKLGDAVFNLYYQTPAAEVANERDVSINRSVGSEFDYIDPADTKQYARYDRKQRMFTSCLSLSNLDHISAFYKDPVHSRLGFLSTKGCKTRVVAICDWWTQDSLKTIHRWAYDFLAKLKTDGTFSHNRIAQIALEKTRIGKPSYCYDLTAATDRFPIWLQKGFLKVCLGDFISDCWSTAISERDFRVANTDQVVRYKVGQPMGALSSWAVFALTHHAVVEFAAYLVGRKSFFDYCIIGDDVAIFDRKVAKKYKEILDLLEVPISIGKSISSEGRPSRAEIAKRLFLNGKEISPIPPDAIFQAGKDVSLFLNLTRLCQERGVTEMFNPIPVYQLLEKFYLNRKDRERCYALLTYPENDLALFKNKRGNDDSLWVRFDNRGRVKSVSNVWSLYDNELIHECFVDTRRNYIKDKARKAYSNLSTDYSEMKGDLANPWGSLLDDFMLDDLYHHPLVKVMRAVRDRCGSIFQSMVFHNDESLMDEIEFVLDPLMTDYRRRSHRTEQNRASLVLETLERLSEFSPRKANLFNPSERSRFGSEILSSIV